MVKKWAYVLHSEIGEILLIGPMRGKKIHLESLATHKQDIKSWEINFKNKDIVTLYYKMSQFQI